MIAKLIVGLFMAGILGGVTPLSDACYTDHTPPPAHTR